MERTRKNILVHKEKGLTILNFVINTGGGGGHAPSACVDEENSGLFK